MKILLIAGGWSTEREVALAGAESVGKALKTLGHAVSLFDLTVESFPRLGSEALRNDFAFISLHGAPGEDGVIQALLDAIDRPYQGSGPAGSLLALHKSAAKQVFAANSLPTPAWEFLSAMPDEGWHPELPAPWFVKSDSGGSSLLLGKAETMASLRGLLKEIFIAGDAAMLESCHQGRDLTCGILGDKSLPPVLIEPVAGNFFDYKSKYEKNGARELCPAPISPEIARKAGDLALAAHTALGLYGCSRSDFILGDDGSLTLLEVNTLPGMTATSLLPQEAAAEGMDFPELIQKLINLGLERRSRP